MRKKATIKRAAHIAKKQGQSILDQAQEFVREEVDLLRRSGVSTPGGSKRTRAKRSARKQAPKRAKRGASSSGARRRRRAS